MTILDKITENAQKNPDRIVFVQDTLEYREELTWAQLNDYSDYLAEYIENEADSKTPVVVYGHKNPLMIVCFIACVKSGRAYCPIDTSVPLSRVNAIIDEVNPDVILAVEPLETSRSVISCEQIKSIVSNGVNRIDRGHYVNADDVFYIIFTSGSTGTPKGVQITRDCLDNFIAWAVTLGNGVGDDKHYTFMNQAPFSFDLSVMDLYLCLYTGGTLWTLPKNIQNDMKLLLESLGKSGANVWVSTPSFADVCLTDPMFSEKLMPGLTDFLFCGEILTNKTVKRLMGRFPNSKIINTYGPTESTCAITEVEVTPELNETCSPLPVGVPKNGTWLRIMDENGNIMPEGESGEIVIVGDSVSVGYFNNAERNKKSFGVTTQDGKEYRFYRTGDAGYLVNGMLHYGGRIDLQVKLHGYRIELEDIESNLLKISGIDQAVVLPKYRDGKVSSLVAGVVCRNKPEDENAAVTDIKEELKKNLPDYMIPKKIRFIDDVPRTANGKVDRKTLGGML